MNIKLLVAHQENECRRMLHSLPVEVHRRRITDEQAYAKFACAEAILRRLRGLERMEERRSAEVAHG